MSSTRLFRGNSTWSNSSKGFKKHIWKLKLPWNSDVKINIIFNVGYMSCSWIPGYIYSVFKSNQTFPYIQHYHYPLQQLVLFFFELYWVSWSQSGPIPGTRKGSFQPQKRSYRRKRNNKSNMVHSKEQICVPNVNQSTTCFPTSFRMPSGFSQESGQGCEHKNGSLILSLHPRLGRLSNLNAPAQKDTSKQNVVGFYRTQLSFTLEVVGTFLHLASSEIRMKSSLH